MSVFCNIVTASPGQAGVSVTVFSRGFQALQYVTFGSAFIDSAPFARRSFNPGKACPKNFSTVTLTTGNRQLTTGNFLTYKTKNPHRLMTGFKKDAGFQPQNLSTPALTTGNRQLTTDNRQLTTKTYLTVQNKKPLIV